VQQGAATAPTSSDLSRPAKAFDLRQRLLSTCVQLVHTEEVTGSIPVSPTRSEAMWIFLEFTMGAIPLAHAGLTRGHGLTRAIRYAAFHRYG
jgi:hypothetical protein